MASNIDAATIATAAASIREKDAEGTDLEAGILLMAKCEEEPKALKLVTWDGPTDCANPKNWSLKKKWLITALVSLYAFVSPVSSSMVAPALTTLGRELNMRNDVEVQMALSIFVLGYAFGPLLFGPASEVFGRTRVLQASNLFYVAWNLGCGFAQNRAEMFVFRFLAGVGGSAPLSVGGAVLSDCWPPEQRGQAVGVYSLAPLLGIVAGPIVGGFTAERTTWRWTFWSTSIAAGVVQVAGLLWLPETHAPTLLKRKQQRLIKATGNYQLRTRIDAPRSLLGCIGDALIRPSRMLTTQPIVQVIALYMAYLFGVIYLIIVAFPMVWTNVYSESIGIGGLNYISFGVGIFTCVQINSRVIDRVYRRLKERNGGVGQPEFHIPSMFVGSIFVPVGLMWYGWSVQGRVHWIMPNIGVAIFGGGAMVCVQSMYAYMIDSYTRFAASGLATAMVLRSLAGFGFPLFAPYLYQRLGYGWGSTVLAFISIVIGVPAPFMFYFFGARLRARSKLAV